MDAARHANFRLDGTNRLWREIDKLDSQSGSRQAVAHLASRDDFDAASRQAEAQFQDGALGECDVGMDEHSLDADVGRMDAESLAVPLITERELAEMLMARPSLKTFRRGDCLSILHRASTLSLVSGSLSGPL